MTPADVKVMWDEVMARLDAAWNAPHQADAHLEMDIIVPQNGPRYAETAVPVAKLTRLQ